MIEGPFGTSVVERILFTLHVYGETCPFSLAKTSDEIEHLGGLKPAETKPVPARER